MKPQGPAVKLLRLAKYRGCYVNIFARRLQEVVVCRCSGCFWSTGEWGACSALCGNGTAMRTVQCLNNGRPASPDLPECNRGCQPALKPQASAKESPTAEQTISLGCLIHVGKAEEMHGKSSACQVCAGCLDLCNVK